MGIGYQKSVVCKLYPREIEALEHISELGGFNGKSSALREMMLVWIEAAVVVIETKSTAKGVWQIIRSMKKLNSRMKILQNNVAEREAKLTDQHNEEVLRMVLDGKSAPWKKVPQ